MPVGVRRADKGELPGLAQMMARAFWDDPVTSWFFPDPTTRPARLRGFFERVELGGPHGRLGEIYTTDGGTAAALWTPPGKWRISLADQVRMLPSLLRIVSPRWIPSRLSAFNELERHHPTAPAHWYLPTLATDPEHQGKGLGSALLSDMLARCDTEGLPSYLESSKEANVPFYERHGFGVIETFDLPNGPRLWLMWRDPR